MTADAALAINAAVAPVHSTCHHKTYLLTCKQFDELIDRAAGRCERCRDVGTEPLQIDHDGPLGTGAVRGLVCARCNALIRTVEIGKRAIDADTARYLADAWHLTQSQITYNPDRMVQRQIRIGDSVWRPYVAVAGTDRSAAIRQFMKWYARDPGARMPKRPDPQPTPEESS